MPESDTRLQAIQTFAAHWGASYLFHPQIGRSLSRRAWEQAFVTALPQVEQAADPTAVQSIMRALTAQQFVSQDAFMDSPIRRIHEGWNEDGHPYVYGQRGDIGTDLLPAPALASDRALEVALSRAERIFGLCKVWLVLRYFAPHLDPGALDALLAEWLPQVEAAVDVAAYHQRLRALAARLGDPHAGVMSPVREDAPAAAQDALAAAPSARRTVLGSAWLGGMRYLRALPGQCVLMTPFAMPDVASLRETFALIQNTCGLILDLRGYPQTHFQHDLVRCLCQAPVSSPRYAIPVVGEPHVQQRSWKVLQHTLSPDGRAVYTRPVVALIDERTQSSAEDFCMYLKIAGRVTFVGRRTAGCVGNATYVNLPGGGRFTFTGMRVTWPDGSPVWGLGISPDVPVIPQTNDRDAILDKGLEVLLGKI